MTYNEIHTLSNNQYTYIYIYMLYFGVSENKGYHRCVAFYWGFTKADDDKPIDLEYQSVRQTRILFLGENPLSRKYNWQPQMLFSYWACSIVS